MTFYGVYTDYRTGALTVGTATVIKETAKKWFIERTQAGEFASTILKEKPHMFETPELAWEKYIQQRYGRLELAQRAVEDASRDLQQAREAYVQWKG